MSVNNLDIILAKVIRNFSHISDSRLQQYFDTSFLCDLDDLFKNKASDAKSWYSFSLSLEQSNFFFSSIEALEKIAPLIADPAKIYMQVAKKRLQLGQMKESAICYGISYRLDPNLKLAKRQFESLQNHLKIKVPEPWKIVSALSDSKKYNKINGPKFAILLIKLIIFFA